MLLRRQKSLRPAHAVSLCGTTGQPQGRRTCSLRPSTSACLNLASASSFSFFRRSFSCIPRHKGLCRVLPYFQPHMARHSFRAEQT